jgi:hypothetical protein
MGIRAVSVITNFVSDWTQAPSNRMELGGQIRDLGSKLQYCVIID